MVQGGLESVAMLLTSRFPVGLFLVLWLLCAAAAAIGWLGIYPYMLRRGPLARFSNGAVGPPTWQSLAGLRAVIGWVGTVSVTPPLARVVCDDVGVHVGPVAPVLGFLVPSLLFKWGDIGVAEVVGSSGVRLRFRAADAPIVLLGLTGRSSLMDELRAHGIEVSPDASPQG
jgi:hypothetical protein